MKESYKVAKKKRKRQIKEALGLLKVEHETKMKELLEASAPEYRPWLGERKPTSNPKRRPRKAEAREALNSRGSVGGKSINDGLNDMGMDILKGKNPASLKIGYTIDPKWERLSQPYKKPNKTDDDEENRRRRPYFVEHMALTKEEKLNMISLITKKEYTKQHEAKRAKVSKAAVKEEVKEPTKTEPKPKGLMARRL